MLMVLNLHSFKGYTHGDGVLQYLDFFRESTSICAVDIFVLISGFFGIKWKVKGIYNLLFQCLFYSFAVYGISVQLGFIPFDKISFLKCFGCFFMSWGFITDYIVLYLISPLLNSFSERASKKELLLFIFVLFVAENTICFTTLILNFVLMYLIGRFVQKSDLVKVSDRKPWPLYLLCTIITSLLTYGLYKFTPINTASTMTLFPLGFAYSSPLIILQAVFLFLCFARMKFTSKLINWCASSCLAVFLIHMHPAIKQIGYYNYTESLYNLPVLEHIGKLTILILAVFFGSILIDKVRIFISNSIYRLLQIIRKSMPDKLFQADTYIPKAIKNII